jgi:pimeloyl-ACP methyl ester carboxylesterase
MCREGFIVGGFASMKWYYKPLQWWLQKEGFHVDFIHPAPRFDLLGLNVWPLEIFLANAIPAVNSISDDLFLVGHSLGGIQSILLADLFPDKIKKVFAIGTPVWGCPLKLYEEAICSLLNVPPEEFKRFQQEVVPRNAKKIVTVSCEDDMLAPRQKCVIEGASNYVVTADDEGISSSHLLLPYLTATIKIISEETRAIATTPSLVPVGTAPQSHHPLG